MAEAKRLQRLRLYRQNIIQYYELGGGLHYKNLTGAGSKGKNDYSENDFIVKVPQNQVNWEYHITETVTI